MKSDEYWRRIERVPLVQERESGDGEAVICRTQDGTLVRVTKPEFFHTDEQREAALAHYEAFYSPRSGDH